MSNWFLSDLHMGHANIIKYTNRPFKDVHHMNWTLTKNWNSVVKPDDTVYIVGDFSMGQPGKYAQHLNGHKILIKGNHDKLSQCRGHFDEIHEDTLELKLGEHKLLLCHYYYKEMLGDFDHKFKDRMPSFKSGQILIHGHSHNSTPMINNKYKAINVSVEHFEYTPISENKIVEIIKSFKY
jgi:calcineurin-like phosphoesterase family protein